MQNGQNGQNGNESRLEPGAAAPTGSTDESIGRPSDWREGRYQRSGARVDQSVETPASSRAKRPKSPATQRPVTLRDYEK
jgi:hypothetical protein